MTKALSISTMHFYGSKSGKLYINQSEREHLIALAEGNVPSFKAFVLTLIYTGCRISEAEELTEVSLQRDDGILLIRTLKRRGFYMREIPIPPHFVSALCAHIARHKTKNTLYPETENHSFPDSRNNTALWKKGSQYHLTADPW